MEDFESWYRGQHPRVLAACAALGGDLDAAREATDEAFTRALERWPAVVEMAAPGGWVQTVALNVLRRHLRRRRILPVARPPAPDITSGPRRITVVVGMGTDPRVAEEILSSFRLPPTKPPSSAAGSSATSVEGHIAGRLLVFGGPPGAGPTPVAGPVTVSSGKTVHVVARCGDVP